MKEYLVAAAFALLTYAAGFVCGAVVTSWHYKAEISEFKANAQAQYAQALEAKAVREKYLQGKADESAVKAKESQDEIEARYKSLLADAADALSVHADSAGGKDSVPSDPKPAAAVSERAGERHAAYRAKLQRLYERQLEIARDCDITAAHYNQLIRLWNEAAR
ncbi:MAG: hypothetical protein SPL30_10200 [Succinivibrio sp.]|nr:hypothetical protein [Succinivibrio sp.]